VAVLAAAACSDANLAEPEGLGLQAARYVGFALDVMEARSIRRHEIDWPAFRAQTFADAGNARTFEATYDAIRAAVARLGDNHSAFLVPSAAVAEPDPSPDPTARLIEAGVGYLEVPPFAGLDTGGDLASLYHSLIEGVDTLGACRWVVDLRGNTGGNQWPMLAGVGPILGEGTVGYFVDPDSLVNTWTYEDGVAALDGFPQAGATVPYDLAVPPLVALLTDSLTASSGEAIAVAFRERAAVRSFGGATYGVSTANDGFWMEDGALLVVTVTALADRSGAVYGGALVPGSSVVGTKTGDRATDAALDAALVWLEGTPCS
jgi:C-terminal processing protease CtpA/Prc